MHDIVKYQINPLLRACGDAMDNIFHISILLSLMAMLYLLTTCVHKEAMDYRFATSKSTPAMLVTSTYSDGNGRHRK
jgi:hypothetical protein